MEKIRRDCKHWTSFYCMKYTRLIMSKESIDFCKKCKNYEVEDGKKNVGKGKK